MSKLHEAPQEGGDAKPESLGVVALDHDLGHLSEGRITIGGESPEHGERACGVVGARCLLLGGSRDPAALDGMLDGRQLWPPDAATPSRSRPWSTCSSRSAAR